jgi:hypothetical protein
MCVLFVAIGLGPCEEKEGENFPSTPIFNHSSLQTTQYSYFTPFII